MKGHCECREIKARDVRLSDGRAIHAPCSKPVACTSCRDFNDAVSVVGQRRECRYCSPLFTDRFFEPSFDMETELIDGFIYSAGGIRVSDLLPSGDRPVNADYLFEEINLIAELKTFKTDYAMQPGFQNKSVERVLSYVEDGIISFEQAQNPENWPGEFGHFANNLLREKIQKRSYDANDQIKRTKELLGREDAFGLAMFLLDGFREVNIDWLGWLFTDPLTRHMSSIDGVLIFSVRQEMPGWDSPFFWDTWFRDSTADAAPFVNYLRTAFTEYLRGLSGL